MAGNLNALGLILVVLLTGAMLMRYGSRPASLWRVAWGIAAASGVMLVAAWLTLALYDESNHDPQLLIPSMCLALLLVFTRASRTCRIAGQAVIVSAFVWSFHVLFLVGPDSGYTADPECASRICDEVTVSHLWTIRSFLAIVAEEDEREYPSGWLMDTCLAEMIPTEDQGWMTSRSVEIHPFWHTPLTGLYGKTYHELSLWYPGGRLKEGLKWLEFRSRQR